jgi:cytochrome bd ubiquinol oxidase subunit II
MNVDVQTAFYLVIGVAVLMYVVLDGFDLGVGALHLLARTDEQRRIFLNAIGPVWDGNEVWIIIVVGGLFAGFPNAYATVLTGFYSAFMILIAGFIFRAAAIEFRSKRTAASWRALWDGVFAVSSIGVAFVIGLLLGNLIQGISLDARQNVLDGCTLFRPYPILVGFFAISLCAMHGAIYLYMKTESDAHETIRRWINPAILVFMISFTTVTVATLVTMPHMIAPLRERPVLLTIPVLALLTILAIPRQIRKERGGWAFFFSCVSILLLLSLYHVGMYPYLLYDPTHPHHSLTIYNAASSAKTLGILLIVVGIGIPLVFAYGFWVYRVFRGKVKIDHSSY